MKPHENMPNRPRSSYSQEITNIFIITLFFGIEVVK